MAHKYTFTVTPTDLVRDESGVADPMKVITDEATTLHDQFVAEGKITTNTSGDEDENGAYVQSIIFTDSATCDEYLAAMAGIGEVEKSGNSRSNHSREDV
jgi:hypothetical protein|tara:strand:+ start:1174 stop:1473 length:300 start_codon:yes stop_codon:yes gene_type:complete